MQTYQYRLFDGQAYSNTATVNINVFNHAPIANDDSYSVHMGRTFQPNNDYGPYGLLRNDSDPNNDPLTVEVVTPPELGQLTIGQGNHFTYVAPNDFAGIQTFEYRVFDGQAYSNTATVTFNVYNNAPTANDDTYSIPMGWLLQSNPDYGPYGLLDNDNDIDNDPLTVEVVTPPELGQLTVNPDGNFSYIAPTGYVGPQTFTYRVSDGFATDTATVTINVTNRLPIANNDNYSIHAGHSLQSHLDDHPYGVLENDSDPDFHAITAELTVPPANGQLTLNPDGTFTYVPDPGFVGIETFNYRVWDSAEAGDPATVTINVWNDPPAANDDSYNVSSDAFAVAADYNGYGAPYAGVLKNDTQSDTVWGTLATSSAHSAPIRDFPLLAGIRCRSVSSAGFMTSAAGSSGGEIPAIPKSITSN